MKLCGVGDLDEPLLVESMHGIPSSLGSSDSPETLPATSHGIEGAIEPSIEVQNNLDAMHVSHATEKKSLASAYAAKYPKSEMEEAQNTMNSALERPQNSISQAPGPSTDEHSKTTQGGRIVRGILITIVSSFAFTFRESLPAVESVVGAVCLVFSSLLLPTLFYLGIRKKYGIVGFKLWSAGGFILAFGGGLMAIIILQTFDKMGW